MNDSDKKKICNGLESLRSPIPFHGCGATIEDDYLTLPDCSWTKIELYLFEPVDRFDTVLYRLINDLPTDKISSDTFNRKAREAIIVTTKEIVKSMHGVASTFEGCNKNDIFRRWYEAYLTAFFLTILEDLKLNVYKLSDAGAGKDLFYDDECYPLYPQKSVVLHQVRKVCDNFKKTYQIYNTKGDQHE